MLNQNRNFWVTILNPERSIKYAGFKIRAFADQQNYQKYLFFYLGWCPWTPKERFFEKNFCCKSSVWPHYLFQYCLSQNTTERQHAKIFSFSHKRKIGVKSRRYLTISKKRRSGFKFWNLSSPVWLNMVNYKKKTWTWFLIFSISNKAMNFWRPQSQRDSTVATSKWKAFEFVLITWYYWVCLNRFQVW